MDNALLPEEKARLSECEETIAKKAPSFIELGEALKAISEGRLYREHGTFEAYCRARWNYSTAYVSRLLTAVETVSEIRMLPIGNILTPANESQVRELARLPDMESRCEAWAEVVERANGDPKAIAARLVKQVVNERLDKKTQPVVEDQTDPENYRTIYLLRADAALEFTKLGYQGKEVTQELVDVARRVASAWNELARTLEKSL